MNQEIFDAVDTAKGRVEVLTPDFEGVAGVSRTQGEKKGKALAALDHFQNIVAADIPTRLQEVVHIIYSSARMGTDDDNELIGCDIQHFSSVKNRLGPKNRPGI